MNETYCRTLPAPSSSCDEESTLCTACKNALQQLLEPLEDDAVSLAIPHQESVAALEAAAADECELCRLLLPMVKEATSVWYKADRINEEPPYTSIQSMVERLDSEVAKVQAGTLWARLLFSTQDGSTTRLADIGFERSRHGPLVVLGRNTASHPELGLAHEWISDCYMHAGCSVTHCQLPTRLIDIGFEDRPRDPRLVVTAGSTGQYLALSHCWGTPSQRTLMTTSENMASLLECIPLTSMAKTFQDAVVVTRKLGYRFLWIDVYCIVQDDPQDWQRECAKMASIFENASVTIAASAAADSDTGFLRQRPDWQANVIEWARYQSLKHQDQEGDVSVEMTPHSPQEGTSCRCIPYYVASRLLFL